MKKAGGKTFTIKIGKLFFITFIFFLLVTTPTEKQSPVDEPSQIDDASPVNSSPEAERITYTPEVSHRGGKALYSLEGDDYQKRIQINVTNNANEALPAGYSVSFSLNTWYLTNKGELQADGDDLRVAYNGTGVFNEIDRVNGTAFNTYKTLIWFQTQSVIAANDYDANYWIFYDNPSISTPPTIRQMSSCSLTTTMMAIIWAGTYLPEVGPSWNTPQVQVTMSFKEPTVPIYIKNQKRMVMSP